MDGFGNTARRLAHNPLGIIALFIVLVYGFASLVVGAGRNLAATHVSLLVGFMVVFPALVLGVFGWLVSRHHTKLYAPKDYEDEGNFLRALGATVPDLPRVESQAANAPAPSGVGGSPREEERRAVYRANRDLFLVHALTPSAKPGQKYDVTVYVKRHKDRPLDDVERAEFFFGRSWGNRVFEGQRDGDVIGVSTAAYGEFLCTCKVTMKDGAVVDLHRYVDFTMAGVLERVLEQKGFRKTAKA